MILSFLSKCMFSIKISKVETTFYNNTRRHCVLHKRQFMVNRFNKTLCRTGFYY